MILVIDAFKLVKGAGKSIGIYNLTRSLVEYLSAENVRRGCPETIIVLGNSYNRADMERNGSKFVLIDRNPLNRKTFTWWELVGVTGVLRRYHADLALFPRGYRPLVYRGKDAVIIHDLIPFWYNEQFPGYLPKVENAYIMNRLKASARHADKVITISDYSRREIEKRVPGSAEHTIVIYNGLNDVNPPAPEGRKNAPYMAAVTSKMPHKNAAGILRTYAVYYKECLHRQIRPLELEIIGIGSTDGFGEGSGLTAEMRRSVHCRGYIGDDAKMHALIAGACFFLFLSLSEGFGFPPLEAMQLGVPVISSNRTSLPEVVGDAGILTDPEDYTGTAQQMIALQQDSVLRQSYVEKGFANIRRFSWDSRTQEYWNALFSQD